MPLSKTEWIARELLRHYLPRERFVYNLRPDWLVNPETGQRLELDIFLPDLGVACEVSGVQHGRFTPGLQRTFSDFEKQQRHDMRKVEVCKARGIELYRLTIFDLTQRRFEPFIQQIMMELGRYEQFRRTPAPTHLFAQADRLSSRKVRGSKYERRKPGLWPLLQRWWRRLIA